MSDPAPKDRQEVLALLRARIVSFAASRVARDFAEDLAQEALLLLTQKYPHVESLEDLVPLSIRIVRFKIASHRRKVRRRGETTSVPVEEMPFADDRPDPETAAVRREALARLKQALARLTGRCQALFRLKLEGHGFAEIREALGAASINTVYTWDSRCRKALLEAMGGAWRQPDEDS